MVPSVKTLLRINYEYIFRNLFTTPRWLNVHVSSLAFTSSYYGRLKCMHTYNDSWFPKSSDLFPASHFMRGFTCSTIIKRYRKRNTTSGKPTKDEVSDSDEDLENEEEIDDDIGTETSEAHKDVTVFLNSLRLDSVLRSGTGTSKRKIEDAFYEGKLRVNGKKVFKKSKNLQIGDEADFIRKVDEDNEKSLFIDRVIVLSVESTEKDRLKVKLRKLKNLSVENYSSDHAYGEDSNSYVKTKK